MQETPPAYPVPPKLEAALDAVLAYWSGLRRGGNEMPFWGDLKLSDLADRGDAAILVDAFEHPRRFRLGFLGKTVAQRYGASLAGKFFDEVEPRSPLDDLQAQCAATIERRGPTYYRHRPAAASSSPYARLLLPMWGNGHIEMLLGAVAEA